MSVKRLVRPRLTTLRLTRHQATRSPAGASASPLRSCVYKSRYGATAGGGTVHPDWPSCVDAARNRVVPRSSRPLPCVTSDVLPSSMPFVSSCAPCRYSEIAARIVVSAFFRHAGAGLLSRSRCSAFADVVTCWSAERQPLRLLPPQYVTRSPSAASRCWASTWIAFAYAADREGPCAGFAVVAGRGVALPTDCDTGLSAFWARSAS